MSDYDALRDLIDRTREEPSVSITHYPRTRAWVVSVGACARCSQSFDAACRAVLDALDGPERGGDDA